MKDKIKYTDWILEIKRQMYEDDCHYEAIESVDMFPEVWKDKYEEGLTWREALNEIIDDAKGVD